MLASPAEVPRPAMSRRLHPEERSLWHALTQSVRPLARRVRVRQPEQSAETGDAPPVNVKTQRPAPSCPAPRADSGSPGGNHELDSRWERQLRSGVLTIDRSIDLHGHNLAQAHARMNQMLHEAVMTDARVLLVVTGKPRNDGSGRGAIRAEIGHWLDSHPLRDRIATVRRAHPRHGGEGALYVILRRRR